MERATEPGMGVMAGICDNCGKEIAPERLQALPQAALCITGTGRQETQRRFGAALFPAVAAVVLLADQASKLWIQQQFAACDDTSLPLVPGWAAFAYTCNKGAAFGLLANETLPFVLVALVVISTAPTLISD